MLLLQALLQPLPVYATAPVRAGFSTSNDRMEKAIGDDQGRILARPVADQNGFARNGRQRAGPADQSAPQGSCRPPDRGGSCRGASGSSRLAVFIRDLCSVVEQAWKGEGGGIRSAKSGAVRQLPR